MKPRLARIYPITDKRLARCASHLEILRDLARGGASIVQIRDKETPASELLPDLLRCVEFAASRGITLIVNDRCDLVLAGGASGVHLGQEDLSPEAARRLLGRRRIIGYSTHNLRQVARTVDLPVDYIGFGPVFPTRSKDRPSPATGKRSLERACQASPHPVVAIGGIGPEQLRPVLEAGACSAAVISAVMVPGEVARRMESLLHIAGGWDPVRE